MAKRPCCHKRKLRRGLWSPEEDEKLINHIAKYGHGCWSSVPKQAGLERCGKSCRLRWINYLRPDLKRGAFSQEEEDLIIHLHSMLGNKWSQIAAKLPGRTDNEVKNFWNSYIKKKLRERGIDPATHRPLAGGGAASTAMTRPVFSDAELIPAESVASLDAPVMPIGTSHVSLPSYQASSHLMSYRETSTLMSYFDMDALNCAAAGAPPPAVIPSVSSSSTLNSMAGPSPGATDEQCNNGDLPWLELGQGGADAAHVGHYGGALDELRWADYFEGAFQAAAASHGAQGQGIYEDIKDATQFNGHGLSSWC